MQGKPGLFSQEKRRLRGRCHCSHPLPDRGYGEGRDRLFLGVHRERTGCTRSVLQTWVDTKENKKIDSESGAETREVGFEVIQISLDKVLDHLM